MSPKTKAKTTKAKTAPSGAKVKFTEKYGVKLASSYEADPEILYIPPPGHALHDPDGCATHDEVRVQEIDRVGRCVRVVTVWTDPDTGKLWVIAGRGNRHDVCEVNRRRRERGDDPIPIQFLRFPGDLDQAVDFVAMENFRRKRPSAVHVAREVLRYHRLGRPWKRIAELLQLDDEDEKMLKRRVPIAYCQPEVVAAIEAREVPLRKARLFGGRAMDGSQALGRDDQLKLLKEMREDKAAKKEARKGAEARPASPGKARVATRIVRTRVAEHLANGRVNHLPSELLPFARAIAAYERFMAGDRGALDYLPAIRQIVEEVVKGEQEQT